MAIKSKSTGEINRMDTKLLAVSAAIFLVSAAVSGAIVTQHILGNQQDQQEDEFYQESFGVEANFENRTKSIEFDANGSVGIDIDFTSEPPRLFLDLSGDGSFSTPFEEAQTDGEVYRFSRETVQQDKMYQFIFSYKIDGEDTWIRLDEVREI